MSAEWSVLELEGLTDLVKDRAASVAAMFPTTADADDLEQEGLIWAATNASKVRELHAREDSLLSLRIWSVLRDKVKTEATHSSQTVGIHRLYEQAG